jgi:hypothetical protein
MVVRSELQGREPWEDPLVADHAEEDEDEDGEDDEVRERRGRCGW